MTRLSLETNELLKIEVLFCVPHIVKSINTTDIYVKFHMEICLSLECVVFKVLFCTELLRLLSLICLCRVVYVSVYAWYHIVSSQA